MAGRFKVSGTATETVETFLLQDAVSHAPAGAVVIGRGEVNVWLRLVDVAGVELSRVEFPGSASDPASLQRHMRRFLAEARPGDLFEFDELGANAAPVGDLDFTDDDDEEEEDDDEG